MKSPTDSSRLCDCRHFLLPYLMLHSHFFLHNYSQRLRASGAISSRKSNIQERTTNRATASLSGNSAQTWWTFLMATWRALVHRGNSWGLIMNVSVPPDGADAFPSISHWIAGVASLSMLTKALANAE